MTSGTSDNIVMAHAELAKMTKRELIEKYVVARLEAGALREQGKRDRAAHEEGFEKANALLSQARQEVQRAEHQRREAEDTVADLRERCAMLTRMCHALVRCADPDEDEES